ncbi:MAG TPA: hypothetical protein VI895_11450 [Bdellovibrionota bacterium]|nr:hypothetical protein [Bdellovibrionota bacterium]
MIRHISIPGLLLLCTCSFPHDINGRVVDRTGTVQAGVVVRFISIDDAGNEVSEIDKTVTDRDGDFDFGTEDSAGSTLILQAELPSGPLRAFAAVDNPQDVDAISDALVSAVLYVTETPGGRSLSDFTAEEINSLSASARETLLADTALDLTDSNAVIGALISSVGRKIADAAGGTISAVPIADVAAPDVTSSPGPFVSNGFCDVLNFHGAFFDFDINEGGVICNVEAAVCGGTVTDCVGDAFDGAVALTVETETFCDVSDPLCGQTGFPGDADYNTSAPSPPALLEDDRELALGPVISDSGSLEVTRKVLTLENQDVVRHLDIFKNLAGADLPLSFTIIGEFGGIPPYRLVTAQDDATEFTKTVDFGAFTTMVANARNPLIGFVIAGPGASVRPDTVIFPLDVGGRYEIKYSLTLAPSETAVFAHYSYVSPSFSADHAKADLQLIYESPDMTGMSAVELNHLRNFRPSVGNVLGEAGSVASNAALTFTDSAGAITSVQAGRDGSFKATVSAISGDTVSVTGSDGTSASVVVP